MNPISDKIQSSTKQIIKKIFDLDEEFEIGIPKDPTHGDLSTSVSFQLTKKVNQTSERKYSPTEICEKIIEEFKDTDFSGKFQNISGYLNYTYSIEDLLVIFGNLMRSVDRDGESLFKSINLSSSSYILEYISPNSTKSLHLGHLMNACLGKSIFKLLTNSGATVRREILFNDRGIGMGKLMYAFEKFETGEKNILEFVEERKKNNQPLLDTLYLWGSTEFENDQEVQSIVSKKVVQWEKEMTEFNERKRKGENPDFTNFPELELWYKVRTISLNSQTPTISRLGCEYDKTWYESDFFDLGQNIASRGFEEKIFRLSDGALLTDLKNYKLSDTVVRKSDGTALYITQDLALAELKKNGTPKDTKYLYIVGNEQKLALQQLFAVCDQLGINPIDSFTHISYPFILLKGKGKMSSRKGNTVFIDSLIDEVKEELIKYNNEISDDDIEKLALAAIKFSFLKYGRTSEVNFDIEDSINTTGFSAIYIMYVFVRTVSLLKGEANDASLINNDLEFNESEKSLIIEIQNMNLAVQQATSEFSPNKVCYALYEIANKFNKFYSENRILDADADLRQKRIQLVKLTNKAIEDSFNLLGIDVIQKM